MKISQPSPNVRVDYHDPVTGEFKQVDSRWVQYMHQLEAVAQAVTGSGTTTQRPTNTSWVGKPYFDTTLGKPIWMKTATVWVDATGTPV